jgi:hypothetical protein
VLGVLLSLLLSILSVEVVDYARDLVGGAVDAAWADAVSTFWMWALGWDVGKQISPLRCASVEMTIAAARCEGCASVEMTIAAARCEGCASVEVTSHAWGSRRRDHGV